MRSLKKDENALKLIALVAKKRRIRSERERFYLHHSKNNNIIAHKAYITHWVNIHSITIINSITAALQIVYIQFQIEKMKWKYGKKKIGNEKPQQRGNGTMLSHFEGSREWTERLFSDFYISHCANQFSSLFLWKLFYWSFKFCDLFWVVLRR